MSWNYQAIKEESDGETVFCVHECYYKKGQLWAWTTEPVHAQGETLEGLQEDLEYMLEDVRSRPVLDMEQLRERVKEGR